MTLDSFYRRIKDEWAGSLAKVEHLDHPHAKEYMSRLLQQGLVEKACWGWYWVPGPAIEVWDFLAVDKNFKVIAGQTAASLWNHDYVHREVYVLKVVDASYGRALKSFGHKHGWAFEVEIARTPPPYVAMDGLFVQPPEEAVLDCLRRWAFVDAFGIVHEHPQLDVREISRRGYWQRLAGTDVRLRSVLEYGYSRLTGRRGRVLSDDVVRREVDEAVEKVVELG